MRQQQQEEEEDEEADKEENKEEVNKTTEREEDEVMNKGGKANAKADKNKEDEAKEADTEIERWTKRIPARRTTERRSMRKGEVEKDEKAEE